MDFKTFINEMSIPNEDKSKNKMRHGMPQITGFDKFRDDMRKEKIDWKLMSIEPGKLIPTQKNFNDEKVDKLKESGWDKFPIITSSDNYVIDGHHRWLAAAELKKPIKCRKIDMTCDDLIDFLKDKPYTEKKKINENLNRR